MLAGITVVRLTEAGRREAGPWPKWHDQLASLIATLHAAAERTHDPTLRQIGDGLEATPGGIVSGVVTACLASQGGIW